MTQSGPVRVDDTATLGMRVAARPTDAASRPTRRIGDLPILRDATPAALRQAEDHASWRSYGFGELILDFNDPSSDVFFVTEGVVRIQVRTASGRELILTDVSAGGMFGEIAAVDGAARTAAVTALVASRVCVVPPDAFLEAACSTPAACKALLRSMTTILRRQSQRLLEREALPVRLRLCAELLRLSHKRHDRNADAGEERIVSPPPPQHVLAARIGARREVVSREINDLARQGLLLKVRGGLVLPRPAALRKAIDAEIDAGASL